VKNITQYFSFFHCYALYISSQDQHSDKNKSQTDSCLQLELINRKDTVLWLEFILFIDILNIVFFSLSQVTALILYFIILTYYYNASYWDGLPFDILFSSIDWN